MPDLQARIRIGAVLDPQLRQVFGDAGRITSRLGATFRGTRIPPSLRQDTRLLDSALGGLDRAQRDVGRSADRMEARLGQVGRRLGTVRRQAADTGRTLGGLRLGAGIRGGSGIGAVAGLGVGVGTAFAAARQFRSAIELERARVDLRGVIQPEPGVTAAAALERAVHRGRDYARRTLATESEILGGLYEASSANLRADLASATAEVGHEVATVTRGAITDVVPVIARSFDLFGREIAGATDEARIRTVGNLLTVLQQSEQISNFQALGASINEGAAGILGSRVDFFQGLSTLAVLQSRGLEGTRAGTGLRALLRDLPRAAEELGFEVARTEDGTLDLAETVDRLRNSVADLSTDARSLRLREAMASEAAEVAQLLFEVTGRVRELSESSRVGGALAENYGRHLDSAGGRARRAGQNFENAGDALSTSLLPALGQVAEPLAGLGRGLAAVIEDSPAARDGILAFAGGVGILGVAIAGAKLGGLTALLASPALPVVLGIIGGYVGGQALNRELGRSTSNLEQDFEALARGQRLAPRTLLSPLVRDDRRIPIAPRPVVQSPPPVVQQTPVLSGRPLLPAPPSEVPAAVSIEQEIREAARARRARRGPRWLRAIDGTTDDPEPVPTERSLRPVQILRIERGAIVVQEARNGRETAFELMRRIEDEAERKANRAQYDEQD